MYLFSSMKLKEFSFFLSLRSIWVLYVELIGPETPQRFIVPDTQSLGKSWISVEQYGLKCPRIFLSRSYLMERVQICLNKGGNRSPSLKIERESCKLDYVSVIPMDVEIQC